MSTARVCQLMGDQHQIISIQQWLIMWLMKHFKTTTNNNRLLATIIFSPTTTLTTFKINAINLN